MNFFERGPTEAYAKEEKAGDAGLESDRNLCMRARAGGCTRFIKSDRATCLSSIRQFP